MSKQKKAGLVLLAYSDSEHEDDEDEDDFQNDLEDEYSQQQQPPLNDSITNNSNDGEIFDENSMATNGRDQNKVVFFEKEIFFEDVYGDDHDLSILEFHQSLLNKTVDDIRIPPPTRMSCSSELQNQIETLWEKVKDGGYDLNLAIQKRKSMRNPSIYEKMISYLQIDEMATNYPKEIYDPEPFLHPESYYEELAKMQKDEMEKREKERKEMEKNPQANNNTNTNPSNNSNPNKRLHPVGITSNQEKKSKWDSGAITTTNTTTGTSVGGGSSSSSQSSAHHSAIIAAALAAANRVKSLTSATTTTTNHPPSTLGAKPTVISAFGTISKKK